MSLTERVAGARTGKVPNVLVQGIWLVGLLPAKEKKCGSAVGFIGVVGVEYELGSFRRELQRPWTQIRGL